MTKKVYVYDLEGNLIMEFETTQECADFFNKERDYINHNLKYCDKFRYKHKWVRLSRKKKTNE